MCVKREKHELLNLGKKAKDTFNLYKIFCDLIMLNFFFFYAINLFSLFHILQYYFK